MNLLLNIAVIALIVAQFTPRGQAFLATDRGAAAVVALAGVAIFLMIPGLLVGNVLNLLFIGVWGYVAYPRLPAAQRFVRRTLRLPPR